MSENLPPASHAPVSDVKNRLQHWRHLKDRMATYGMAIGGSSVIVAIVLIFFYLLYVVVPLFKAPDADALSRFQVPELASGATLHMTVEEQNRIATRFTEQGVIAFFRTQDGSILKEENIPLAQNQKITAFSAGDLASGVVAYGFNNGSVLVLKTVYKIVFEGETKKVVPSIEYPLGTDPIELFPGEAISHVAVRAGEETTTILAASESNNLQVLKLVKEQSFLNEDESSFEKIISRIEGVGNVHSLHVNTDQRLAYVARVNGDIVTIDTSGDEAVVLDTVVLVDPGDQLSEVQFLTGGISLLVGTQLGHLSQWFPVAQTDSPPRLTKIRSFESMDGAINHIVTEQRRKGFYAADEKGNVNIYHSTANRLVLSERIGESGLTALTVSPRADRFLVQDRDGFIHVWYVDNEHPEISFSVLWGDVWYESYKEPEYIWQSSSANNDFEPKFSLVPLTFGTIKAAFYAMLFAIPLAIFGAIFTAYFMTPRMRTLVKPSIEIMEALPTVILGFLAGLWLAPVIEKSLPGTFLFLLIMPPGVLFFALLWRLLPDRLRMSVSEGWQAAILILPVILLGYLAFALGPWLEVVMFGGNMPEWLSRELGWNYDQRNSLVVGIAMGVAVIPTIFSITEDAIFSVPKHLTLGSLALGATPWQTLIYVVILTASPGIFSAIMIGLGRAVGETMIVLMATGNTAVMDFSIFQGMRTLSANIAVEMPESEVNSSHYRILFLAALVLFVITFLFNTLAEIIRQRLRQKYSSL